MLERAHLTLGYCHFLPLDTTGNVVGPFIEILSQHQDPHGRPSVLRRNTGNDQAISYEDTTTMVAVRFLIVHVAAFMATGADAANEKLWIRAEATHDKRWELDPEESWESMCARSQPANGLTA